jgi:thiol-disulfide isomerase/thioredoxin
MLPEGEERDGRADERHTRTRRRVKADEGPGLGEPLGGRLPAFPFGPGRGAYSAGTRRALALALALGVVVAVAVGALLAGGGAHAPLRVVTIPAADRSASAALLRAAEAVGFEPHVIDGVGRVEGDPLTVANPPSASSLLAPGALAPPFVLRTPTGTPLSLRTLRGRAVLLEFFATWCPHCDAEAPHLARLFSSLRHSRDAFVAVNADGETAPSVLAYHIYFELAFPALLDPSSDPGSFSSAGSPGPVSTAYRVAEFPTFYVLDPGGRIVWAGQGEQPDLLLARELERAAAPPHG